MLCYDHTGAHTGESTGDWRSFNGSRQAAVNRLAAAFPELRGYDVNIERPLVRINTPGHVWYECSNAQYQVRDW